MDPIVNLLLRGAFGFIRTSVWINITGHTDTRENGVWMVFVGLIIGKAIVSVFFGIYLGLVN